MAKTSVKSSLKGGESTSV